MARCVIRKDGQRRRRAFTLIELLIVMTVVTVLASLLLPALRHAKESANRTVCMNNLRQIGLAMTGYAADNDGWLPTPSCLPLNLGVQSPLYTGNPLCPSVVISLVPPQASTPPPQTSQFYWMLQPYLANGRCFYCPSLRFDYLGQPWNADTMLPLLLGGGDAAGMPLVDYAGNPFYQLARDPACRGATVFGVDLLSGLWAGTAPNGALLFDSTFVTLAGTIQNHVVNGEEIGKNVLFYDGSVRWVAREKFRWDSSATCP